MLHSTTATISAPVTVGLSSGGGFGLVKSINESCVTGGSADNGQRVICTQQGLACVLVRLLAWWPAETGTLLMPCIA
ncbi:hypothetical protein BaRGS_00016842, partial [Batillaria attramentaria]